MVRRKDPFWDYAEDLKGRFICRYCNKNYPGGIARVKSHLSRQPGRDIAICACVPEDVQALALHAVRGKEFPYKKRKTAKLAIYSASIEGNGAESSFSPSTSCPDSAGLHQTSLLQVCGKKDKELVDRMVAQAFIMNNISIGVVQSPSFIAMVKAISEFGIDYKLPNYTTLCTKLVQDARRDVDEYVSTVKQSWSLTGCSLMLDVWDDMQDGFFTNVVAYSPKGSVFLKSFKRLGISEIEVYSGDILLSVIDDIGPENVVQVVVNGAYDYDCVDNSTTERYPHIYRTRCVSHAIQLLLEDIYKEVEWIHSIFDEAKLVVDFMYTYTTVSKLLRGFTGEKELKRPCKTKFSSYFDMVQSFLDVEVNLQLMVASRDWRDIIDNENTTAEKVAEIIQSATFWNGVKEVIFVLDPLIEVLHLVDGRGSTAGYLYEAMEKVTVEFEQNRNSDPMKYSKLVKLFELKRDGHILHKIHAAAAFLNPSFMYDGKFKYEQTDVKDGMNYVVERMVHPSEMDDFAAELLLYNGKSQRLFNTLSVLMMKKAHPKDLIYTRLNTKMMVDYTDFEIQDTYAVTIAKLGKLPDDIDIGDGEFCKEGSIDNVA
ncbi:hypothetical protein GIB67_024528 [Kingdonia uniflora]|uniref:BED-type domain-containing protein n=1 Tax=Kingdonia uniflora TaxID=39325 RepID=A0A7J7LNR4_9MAGN|nr:hypothetical protein GIB67_024528 [Kingdonia uniflora]